MSTYAQTLAIFDDVTRDVSRYHFSVAQVDRFMNRALIELTERTRHIDDQYVANIVANTAVYAINAQGYDIFRVEYDDVVMLPIDRAGLRHADRDWSSRTGEPKYYYLDEIYTSQDYLSVGLWPTPSSNVTNGLRVWYHGHPETQTYTKPTTELEVPDWASGAVVFYMLYLAYIADTKIQSFEAAAIYKMLYEDILERFVIRSRDNVPKRWSAGAASGPNMSVLNRLPVRITE